jgi:hypothetical protein
MKCAVLLQGQGRGLEFLEVRAEPVQNSGQQKEGEGNTDSRGQSRKEVHSPGSMSACLQERQDRAMEHSLRGT